MCNSKKNRGKGHWTLVSEKPNKKVVKTNEPKKQQCGGVDLSDSLLSPRCGRSWSPSARRSPYYVEWPTHSARMLQRSPEVCRCPDESSRSLLLAAANGDTEACTTLLDAGVDPNCRCSLGRRPLHYAAIHAHTSVCRLLLVHGATSDCDLFDESDDDDEDYWFARNGGWTPLHYSAMNGDVRTMKVLMLDLGPDHYYRYFDGPVDLNARTIEGRTPLYLAVMMGHFSAAMLLTNPGNQPYGGFIEHGGQWLLSDAAANGHTETCSNLVKLSALRDVVCDWRRRDPLHNAAKNGRVATCDALLDREGIAVDRRNWEGHTALHCACDSRDLVTCTTLLDHHANVNAVGRQDSQTPLLRAVGKGDTGISKLFLEHGADVDRGDVWGRTPLRTAAEKGNAAMCELLLANGAFVDASRSYGDGETALLSGAAAGHTETCQLLLGYGAEPTCANNDSRSPLLAASGHADAGNTLVLLICSPAVTCALTVCV